MSSFCIPLQSLKAASLSGMTHILPLSIYGYYLQLYVLSSVLPEHGEHFCAEPRIPAPQDKQQLRAMDLFSGCGGFTVGMERRYAIFAFANRS